MVRMALQPCDLAPGMAEIMKRLVQDTRETRGLKVKPCICKQLMGFTKLNSGCENTDDMWGEHCGEIH